MSKLESFLTPEEEQDIVNAIIEAETKTSGEIRVHIEHTCNNKNVNERALEVFNALNMHNTKQANGVLFYIAVSDRCFAIYGDKGIHTKVSDYFWNDTKTILESHFKQNEFKTGLVKGITMAGEKLKHYFPWDNSDEDELPNTISKG